MAKCEAITRKGSQCTRFAVQGDYCSLHHDKLGFWQTTHVCERPTMRDITETCLIGRGISVDRSSICDDESHWKGDLFAVQRIFRVSFVGSAIVIRRHRLPLSKNGKISKKSLYRTFARTDFIKAELLALGTYGPHIESIGTGPDESETDTIADTTADTTDVTTAVTTAVATAVTTDVTTDVATDKQSASATTGLLCVMVFIMGFLAGRHFQ